jgi:hypothetical protein
LPVGHPCFKDLAGRELQPEPIAVVAWKDMKMHVEDVLAGSLTVGKEEVDALAPKIRRP